MKFPRLLPALVAVFLSVFNTSVLAEGKRILVQSTTSTQNSGLYDYLLPKFEAQTGLKVSVVAVGTGQAIRNAMNGDADVLLVHARAAEERFVAEGYGVERFDLMYNDFVVIGPAADPLGLAGIRDLAGVMERLAGGQGKWVSRGDDSGTHKKERALWSEAGQGAAAAPSEWYFEAGAGMGATLRLAVELEGYTLSDRATWLAFEGKQDHRVLWEGAPELFNQYGIIAVNPARHDHVNTAGATAFIDWMLGPAGQAAIAGFRVGGRQLFFPNATAPTQ